MDNFEVNSWTAGANITNWFLMVMAILFVIARLGTKYSIFRRLMTDDYLSIVSAVLCAAQTLAISMAIANGFGDHHDIARSVDGVLKSQYTAAILFIVTMCFSKLALIHFIWSMTPATSDRRTAVSLQVFTILWTVTGVITSCFQCKPPRTWDSLNGECFNIRIWEYYLGITNILSEAGIITQALLITTGIQACWTKKCMLASIFGIRVSLIEQLSVIAGIIVQLFYQTKTTSPIEATSDAWAALVSMQIVQCFSIATSCAPQFKPFMDSLRSSGMRVDGMTTSSTPSRAKYELSTLRQKLTVHSSHFHDLFTINRVKDTHQTTISATGPIFDCDAESQSSQAHIIRETRTFTVTKSPRESTKQLSG
ncbi:hypothetical protein BBP40_010735 [Aspergillus hancockii]|nr:hypothetical protein BBP40_010735 [Aspergillus hancockii]